MVGPPCGCGSVSNSRRGVITHTGGLSVTADSTSLALTGYAINTRTGVVTAAAALNDTDLGRIPLFDLGAAPAQVDCAATAQLAPASAGALTAVFGAPDLSGADLSGADLGDACVAPRA